MGTELVAPFPADRYVTIPRVPVFVQHCTVLRGRVICFGPRQLAKIAERCNRRIAETGDYVPITIGHTPDPKDAKPDPEVIGFAGPFRCGQYRGRAAIFADFHVYRQDADKLRRYPRRSPEVWIGQRLEDTYIDPIALLGGTTPKLDMGLLLYSAQRNGQQCWKYAAAPAAGNVFVPETTVVKEQQMLTPEDVQTLINAIEQLDWVQWVKNLFAQASAEQPAEELTKQQEEPASDEPKEPEKNALPSEEADVTPEKARQILRDGEVRGHPLTEAQRGMFGAIAGKAKSAKTADANLLRYQQLQAEVEQLRNELSSERQARKNAQRRAILQTLSQVYQFDLDKEFERCKAERLSDDQFEDHVACIKENYQRLPLGAILPTGFMGSEPEAGNELYWKMHEKAKQIAERKALRGEPVSYEETVELVRAGKL